MARKTRHGPRAAQLLRWACAASLLLAAAVAPLNSIGQPSPKSSASAISAAPGRTPVKPSGEVGVRWRDLKPAQQASLKPLEQEWAVIDAPSKQKWLQLAGSFPKMSALEQSRVQARMADWTKLTPLERGKVRLNFREAAQLPSQDRQARWDAYQALSPEQKRQLAARAAPVSAIGSESARKSADRGDKPLRDPSQTKSNIVPNPALANRPNAIGPTVVRASPGATTTAISKRPAPPSHQQAGMPKIAATSEFVNKETLLPKRGPQGAATHSGPSPAARPEPRQ